MSFESISSLPEVSGQQAEGIVRRHLEPRCLGLQVGFQAVSMGPWGQILFTPQDPHCFRKPVWPMN